MVIVPCLLLMGSSVGERAKGLAFFCFMWAILSLPLNISCHIVLNLIRIRLHPAAAAVLILGTALLIESAMRRRGMKGWGKNHTCTVLAFLLAFPLALILFSGAIRRHDWYQGLQSSLMFGIGFFFVIWEALEGEALRRFQRIFGWIEPRIKVTAVISFPIFILGLPAMALFHQYIRWLRWGILGAAGLIAIVLCLLPTEAVEVLSKRLPKI